MYIHISFTFISIYTHTFTFTSTLHLYSHLHLHLYTTLCLCACAVVWLCLCVRTSEWRHAVLCLLRTSDRLFCYHVCMSVCRFGLFSPSACRFVCLSICESFYLYFLCLSITWTVSLFVCMFILASTAKGGMSVL